jgi:hypothetical protein
MLKALYDRYEKIEEFILKGTINNAVPFLRDGFFKKPEQPYPATNPISLKTSTDSNFLIHLFQYYLV